jgi:hypothetical protein
LGLIISNEEKSFIALTLGRTNQRKLINLSPQKSRK